jgi:hypothetical protein
MSFSRINAQLQAKNYKVEAGKGLHVKDGETVTIMSGFTFSEESEAAQAILAKQKIALDEAKKAEDKANADLAEMKRIAYAIKDIMTQLKECKNSGTLDSDFAKGLKKDLEHYGKLQHALCASLTSSNSHASSAAAPTESVDQSPSTRRSINK